MLASRYLIFCRNLESLRGLLFLEFMYTPSTFGALQHEDSRAAQTVLILSETFYQLLPSPASAATEEPTPSVSQMPVVFEDEQVAKAVVGGAEIDGRIAADESADKALEVAAQLQRQYVQVGRNVLVFAPSLTGNTWNPSGLVLHLQHFIRHHPIWRSDFWLESFYRAVRDEVGKMIDPTTGSSTRLVELFAAADADDAAALEADTTLIVGATEQSHNAPTNAQSPRRAISSPSTGGSQGASFAQNSSDTDPTYTYCQVRQCMNSMLC